MISSSGLALLAALLGVARPGPEEDAPPPNRELLEFIASFQTADGEWIDPLSLPEAEQEPNEDESEENKPDDQDAAGSNPQR